MAACAGVPRVIVVVAGTVGVSVGLTAVSVGGNGVVSVDGYDSVGGFVGIGTCGGIGVRAAHKSHHMGGMLSHGTRTTTFLARYGSLEVLSPGLVFTGVLYGWLGGG